eukprot:403367810
MNQLQNRFNKKETKTVRNEWYIFKAGWEFQKDRLFNQGVQNSEDYFYTYHTWNDYKDNMQIFIWDFTVRYCQKFLRLRIQDMNALLEYLKDVKEFTQFGYSRGKILPWTAAILLFFCNVYLKRLDVTLEKITQVVQMPNLKDFQNCFEYLKKIYFEQQRDKAYPNLKHIIDEALKELDNSHQKVCIRQPAFYMAAKMLTEYIFLSFLDEKKNPHHYQNQDYIASIIAVLMSFDLYGSPQNIQKVINAFAKHKESLAHYVKPDDIVTYYKEIYPEATELIPCWQFLRQDFKEFIQPDKLQKN